jgi:hypothetical protein
MGLTGAELSRGFWAEAVAPLLAAEMPRPRYAAGRFGTGSDVLGLDDAMSRDHDWGCRLAVLVDSGECDAVPALRELLARRLPASFRGHPVRFPLSWDSSVSHRAEVATVGEFAADRLGADPVRGLTVLEVTAGPVFANDTRELGRVRSLLRWYPPDVERYVLAGGWQRVSQRLPFVGRTADRGDELGSRLLCAGLAGDLMWLAFALSRRWPPYEKWRGTVFGNLPVATSLSVLLLVSVTAQKWRERGAALCAAIEVLTSLQRSAGLPAPSSGVVPFHDRPYHGLNDDLAAKLLAEVTDSGRGRVAGRGRLRGTLGRQRRRAVQPVPARGGAGRLPGVDERRVTGDKGGRARLDLGEPAVMHHRQAAVQERFPCRRGRGADGKGEVVLAPAFPLVCRKRPPGQVRGMAGLGHRLARRDRDLRVQPEHRGT